MLHLYSVSWLSATDAGGVSQVESIVIADMIITR